ncbi:hypothetical protein AOZ07_03130 [Glutamicibacter halophytocola]|uniref:glycosyl hydrolase family 18 protein n=1 Tax=Glutamicibacter halophytocola TaxID=1933880 RepID=UPI0006D4ACDD|nr:glycosyl hydrolase family 18 protein [Glutamicibacter halophytocola]ALG28092.1 hypothetical protein AOZ07_03130 [Glutamicibacter halophytocola]
MMTPNVWVWVGLSWTERIRMVLENYGDRLTDVSIFGWRVGANGALEQTFDPSLLDVYRARWPHLRFWLCFRNDGIGSIFTALRNDATARERLMSDLGDVIDTHPWLYGIDIDLEQGGAASNNVAAEALFKQVADLAHGRNMKASAALPALTSTGSVGGEDWVRYKQLGAMLDHVSIMSYDFAWSGSAPGPVSPGFWLEEVYNWASSQITPSKISMGLPLYAYFWSIHDYPESWGATRRGISGTYYSAWQYFSGSRAWSDSGSHYPIGWVAYRDSSSMSAWGFLDCYDWKEPTQWEDSNGVFSGIFANREYAVRYGLPAGVPQWSVADNSVGSSYVDYEFNAEPVIASNGDTVSPKVGYTLTAEIIQREPVAATIIDDYATSAQQLNAVYTQPSGAWTYQQVTSSYKQYRGTGTLRFGNDFGAQSLYAMARFQFATAGRFSVTSQGITAELSSTGELKLLRGSTALATKQLGAQVVGGAAQVGRCVLALRVRENSARVYFSNAETSIPMQLEVSTTPPGGPTEFSSTGTAWIDHSYLGDGWWYQPREAVEIVINGVSKVLGRIERTGVTWDDKNRFRPNADVEESATRETGVSLDWVYAHWKDLPITTGVNTTYRVRPLDHDLWLGRLMVLDRDGASIVYFTDATTITHWRGRAVLDWGLQGIALWSLGQEDMRLYESLEGGLLPANTKRLDE